VLRSKQLGFMQVFCHTIDITFMVTVYNCYLLDLATLSLSMTNLNFL